ncbi:Na+/H+ antiporter [Terriglobus albidus]|uniref:Na+/H+ antiporter n=1 Tax=Terriglobus albidus TaxID=1592106 RepID=A0A5B9EB82_9BACT|nr:Na+/H+ antiporter [Terriglobus albidus]QEE28954.1 Na+/H+ antiporter [Terriglobus albidus]
MEQFATVLILLFAVSISKAAARLSRIPLPLLQIGLGVALAAFHVHMPLDPGLFLVLFVAPLLYVDANLFPRAEVRALGKPILEMAVGLVFFTVLGAGYFIDWMIPSMPLAACFALAAVLSPTDAVAVSGLIGLKRLPTRLLHLLEGEALLNDATGLVCLRFAVIAVLTGYFSPAGASISFLTVVLGGLAAGAFLSFILMSVEKGVERTIGAYPAAQILRTLLLPFASYLLAEHFKLSGILAAVAAGFVASWLLQEIPEVETRIKSEAVTDLMQFTLNGLIFVLLGLQLQAIAKSIPSVVKQENFASAWVLGAFVLSITLVVGALRFLWTWFVLEWSFFRHKHEGGRAQHTPWRLLAATMLAGVRGAITLAAVLSIPLTRQDGTPFPGRDLAVLLASGVILFSMIAAAVGLPLVLKGLEEPPESSAEAKFRNARVLTAQAAIGRIEEVEHRLSQNSPYADSYASIASRLMDYYRRRIEAFVGDQSSRIKADRLRVAERTIRLEAVRAERKEISRMLHNHELEPGQARALLKKLDNTEATLKGG